MLIDGFTVTAQVVNFIILVWLLKRFLYKPILDAIDAREGRIAKDIADAQSSLAAATAERETFQHKSASLDNERAELLAQAHAAAEAERLRLLGEARQEAEAARTRWIEALRTERVSLHEVVGQKAHDEVFAIARKALSDLAGVDLEERVVHVFVRRLGQLAGDARQALATALEADPGSALVRSAFELTVGQRAVIEEAARQVLGTTTPLRFEVAPALVSGVELVVGGQKVAWSIAEYLLLLEQGVGQLLDEAAL